MKKYNVILADPPWKYRTDMVTGYWSQVIGSLSINVERRIEGHGRTTNV